MNCVRLIGAGWSVKDGLLSQATYEAHWVQLATYCQSKGMYLYPVDCFKNYSSAVYGGTTPTNAEYAAVVSGVIAAFAAAGLNDTIIGYDFCQEADYAIWDAGTDALGTPGKYYNGQVAADVVAIYGLIKANAAVIAANIPYGLTASVIELVTAHTIAFQTACDYIDYHLYPEIGYGVTPPSVAETLATSSFYSNKDVLFGELGRDNAATAPTPAQWIGGGLDTSMSANNVIRGSLLWELQTQPGAVAGNLYGAYDPSGVPVVAITKPQIQHTSTATSPATPAKPVLVNGALYCNPRGSTTFDKVRWYKNGEFLSATDTGRLDDAAAWTSTRALYQAAILDEAAAEGTKSDGIWVGREAPFEQRHAGALPPRAG